MDALDMGNFVSTEFGVRSNGMSPARQRIEAAARRFQETRTPQKPQRPVDIYLAPDPVISRLRAERDYQARRIAYLTERERRWRITRFRQRLGKHGLYITLAEIAQEVCAKHNISLLDLKSERRFKWLAEARHEFCWRASRETPHSLVRIGRFLGGRDHSTVHSSIRRHQARIGAGEAV